MRDQGVRADMIRFGRCPPPDMPGALAAKAIDAYFVGEPHAARAELDGSGRILYHAKDIWPRFVSCVLVVTEKLIASALQSCGISFGASRERRVGGDPPRRRRPAGVSLFPAGREAHSIRPHATSGSRQLPDVDAG